MEIGSQSIQLHIAPDVCTYSDQFAPRFGIAAPAAVGVCSPWGPASSGTLGTMDDISSQEAPQCDFKIKQTARPLFRIY
jgi:hypothetical protein